MNTDLPYDGPGRLGDSSVAGPPGRREDYEDFYRVNFHRLVVHLTVTYSGGEAMDLAQEAMVAAWERWDNIVSPQAWVYTVAKRLALRSRSSRGREVLASDSMELASTTIEDFSNDIAEKEAVAQWTESLPSAVRASVSLALDGYSSSEAASILGLDSSTVRAHRQRAREYFVEGNATERHIYALKNRLTFGSLENRLKVIREIFTEVRANPPLSVRYINLLTSFVRKNAQIKEGIPYIVGRTIRSDIQQALKVIASPYRSLGGAPPRLNLRETDLSGADLRGADLRGADLSHCRLDGSDLQHADLSSARLIDASLRNARLQDAKLTRAALIGARLQRARLQDADLSEAQLEKADLREARLQDANLRRAVLRWADLREARLQDVNLTGAVFHKAIMTGANLAGTHFSAEQMDRSKPATVSTGRSPERFIHDLGDLRDRAGSPSLKAIQRASSGRLSPSTVSDVLCGKRARPPSREFVHDYVTACGRLAEEAGFDIREFCDLKQWNGDLSQVHHWLAEQKRTSRQQRVAARKEARTSRNRQSRRVNTAVA